MSKMYINKFDEQSHFSRATILIDKMPTKSADAGRDKSDIIVPPTFKVSTRDAIKELKNSILS